jgi:uncharacterized phage-associated protein
MRGQRLFRERIVAWDHGPVVQELYHTYKQFGSQPIPVVENFDFDIFDVADRKALDDVLGYYGQFSAWRLRNMTHDEKPWADTYKKLQGAEIPLDTMVDYFRPLIDEDYVKNLYEQGKVQKGAG